MGTIAARSFRVFGNLAQKAGPYLLLEILLPGGTLFALLFFLYRRGQQPGATAAPRDVLARWITILRSGVIIAQLSDIASAWRGRHRERDGLEALAMMPV